MLSGDMEKLYPSAKTLVKECVASRLHAKDATLYGFSDEAQECAQNYMGWTDLATNQAYRCGTDCKFISNLLECHSIGFI